MATNAYDFMLWYKDNTPTAEELVDYINDVFTEGNHRGNLKDIIYDFAYYDKDNGEETRSFFKSEVETVEDVGGGEGDGEYTCYTMHFKNVDVYIKIEGEYQSYQGSEFHDKYFVVTPSKKVITVYEK